MNCYLCSDVGEGEVGAGDGGLGEGGWAGWQQLGMKFAYVRLTHCSNGLFLLMFLRQITQVRIAVCWVLRLIRCQLILEVSWEPRLVCGILTKLKSWCEGRCWWYNDDGERGWQPLVAMCKRHAPSNDRAIESKVMSKARICKRTFAKHNRILECYHYKKWSKKLHVLGNAHPVYTCIPVCTYLFMCNIYVQFLTMTI